MNEKNRKANALKNLLKTAVREVIREELSSILAESLKAVVPLVRESNIQPPAPVKRKSVADRVFFDNTPPPPQEITEAASNIKKGTFNIADLAAMVSTDESDPEFKNISSSDVDDFINRYVPRG